jgi:hypothetical protein
MAKSARDALASSSSHLAHTQQRNNNRVSRRADKAAVDYRLIDQPMDDKPNYNVFDIVLGVCKPIIPTAWMKRMIGMLLLTR